MPFPFPHGRVGVAVGPTVVDGGAEVLGANEGASEQKNDCSFVKKEKSRKYIG